MKIKKSSKIRSKITKKIMKLIKYNKKNSMINKR